MRLLAFFIAVAPLACSQSALDQLKAYQNGNATPAQAAQQTAALSAATATKYDIVGIKVGMTIQEALAALKAHAPNFRLKPESIKYDVVANPMTYGIWATSPNIYNGDNPVYDKVYKGASTERLPTDSEQFYFLLAMPPNRPTVSKVTRFIRWSLNTAPHQDTLASDLIKKYGTPSSDTGAEKFNGNGSRDMLWVDDSRGNRTSAQEVASCLGGTNTITFQFPWPESGIVGVNLPPNSTNIKSSLENPRLRTNAEPCAQFTIIVAGFFDTRSLRYPPAPNVVGGLAVMIASGPMDRSATEATRAYLMQAAKDRDTKQSKAAEQNRPKM